MPKWPGPEVRAALAVQREVDDAWKRHRQMCYRCSSDSSIVQATCLPGTGLKADVEDAARMVKVRREQENLAVMGQEPLFKLPGAV